MRCRSCDSELLDSTTTCLACGASSQEALLEELLGRYVEQRVVDGTVVDPDELGQDYPELLDALREHIREYERLSLSLAPPEDLRSRTLLHYRIVEELGRGGMGEVYLAEDTKLGRRVALKVLPAEMAENPERFLRFQREARLVASLNHPNVVTLHSVEEADGLAFLTMELVEGRTLRARIEDGDLETAEVLDLAVQLADALVAAHGRGIIHRDLKPANVMVDGEGRLKVLDFGLAKLRPPPSIEGEPGSKSLSITADGRILGTVPYMAPEQLEGGETDPRTDIFSFGILLYEMATGRRPFRGSNTALLMTKILHDAPEPLRKTDPRSLQGILGRCLEKDPDERYASAAELREALGELRDQSKSARGLPGWTAAAFVAVLVFVAVLAGPWSERAPPAGVASNPRSSVAVLLFENVARDAELDWLRLGLARMLITDLAQSPEIVVMAPDQIRRILRDLGVGDGEAPSSEHLAALHERASVDAVLQGDFVRVDEELRIQFQLRRAVNGEIVTGDRIDGRLEGLFSMVDVLSRVIRGHFEIPHRAELPASVEDITTSSLEAWRHFTEHAVLLRQSKRREAIAALKKAVEIDPNFALALAELGLMHEALGHATRFRDDTRRAFELVDRLPLDQRFRIQGVYYGSRWTTLDQAIEVYEKALRVYPFKNSWRNNLARYYAFQERYEDAREQFEQLVARDTNWSGTYFELAGTHAALGQPEEGYPILADFADRHPDDWWLSLARAWFLMDWGKTAEAESALRRAGELAAGGDQLHVTAVRWRFRVLAEDWPAAAAEAAALVRDGDPYLRWRGAVSQARILLFQGHSAEALEWFERGADAYREPNAFTALARSFKAELHLARDEPAAALVEARRALEDGREEWPWLRGLFLSALAEQDLGRPATADAFLTRLRQRWEATPNRVEERQLLHLSGLLALARGQSGVAVEALTQAAALLPPRGVELHLHVYPEHVAIFSALGEAALAVGREAEAHRALERATAAGSERVEQPLAYVRAFYLLGLLSEQRGESGAARRAFERFLAYWHDGDLDRTRILEAEAAIKELSDQPPSSSGSPLV